MSALEPSFSIKQKETEKQKMYQYNSATMQGQIGDRSWRRNQNTVRFKPTKRLGPVSHTVLVALILAVLGLIYLTQITKTSTYGYEINDLNNEKEQLLSEQRDLEVETARLQALERVSQSNVAAQLNAPAQTDFAHTN